MEQNVEKTLADFEEMLNDEEPLQNDPSVSESDKPSLSDDDMEDPEDIEIGESQVGDGKKYVLDEPDRKEIMYGDKRMIVSNKEYVIESVSYQEEVAKSKIIAKDFETSRKNADVKWVQTRMVILYKDSDYKSSLPNVKYFRDKYPNPQTGKRAWRPTHQVITNQEEYDDQFASAVSKHHYKFCQKFGKNPKEFSLEDFKRELVGKKVILRQVEQKFDGKIYRRLDIHNFVD